MSFKDSVLLPQTDFPMKANLPDLEKRLLDYWKKIKLYDKISDKTKGRPKFILHDGPPYANGHLHMGHALNKILKDATLKYQRLLGKDCPFVPGWDCHGLPIEWKIEESYREKNISKEQVLAEQFRKECRDFAQKWVDIQKEESQLLGALGDWDHPYLTMQYQNEAQIVSELHKILMNSGLYKGLKPVQWSVVEKTALAEAEVEYRDKTSPSLYIKFLLSAPLKGLDKVYALIWTTTPWTLPANRAVAYGKDTSYVIVQIDETFYLLAENRVATLAKTLGRDDFKIITEVASQELENLKAWHPLHRDGYDFQVPFLCGDHVTTDQGTGLVHTAPSHGVEDFELGRQYDLEVPTYVGDDGVYNTHTPTFAGLHIFKANPIIQEALKKEEALLFEGTITHSYPHSWRSKAPLIYRATPQWFVSMDDTGLRHKALDAIEDIEWFPSQSKNRLKAMINDRPDWCLSRQRSWGVPIAIFVSKKTGEPLKDETVNQRIVNLFQEHGTDIWYSWDSQKFLGPDYNPNEYEKSLDILDVWFESGVSYSYVLEKNSNLAFPADLYLEGSDQHRGWFQSAMLTSCSTRHQAPFKAVMTHGFVVNSHGQKMSKSLGNAIDVWEILQKHGADILRLLVLSVDCSEDIKVSIDTIKRQEEYYRKIRNTLRYLLGNLHSFTPKDCLAYEDLPELEKWVLSRLVEVWDCLKKDIHSFNYHSTFTQLYNFCTLDLSAFYFDIRKDTLYCDNPNSPKYQAVLTVLHHLFDYLCLWFAPILSFTMEEAWQHRYPDSSIFLKDIPPFPLAWKNSDILEKWQIIRDVRRMATGALELDRAQGSIRSSLEAHIELQVKNPETFELLEKYPLAELFIVSSVTLKKKRDPQTEAMESDDALQAHVKTSPATGQKCERCWRILPEVGTLPQALTLCKRCEEVVKTQ